MQFSGKYPADIHNFITSTAVSFYLMSEENTQQSNISRPHSIHQIQFCCVITTIFLLQKIFLTVENRVFADFSHQMQIFPSGAIQPDWI